MSAPSGKTAAGDEAAIAADLARAIGRPVLAIEPMDEGHSGLTYRVRLDGDEGVLRLPAPNVRPSGPADVARQGRIMAALHAEGVRTPPIIGLSAGPMVGGRPFVLMRRVAGERVERAVAAAAPAELGAAAAGALAGVHAVPVARSGIGEEEPRGLEAEIARWTWLLDRAPAELTPRAPDLARALLAARPAERPPTLVHGDFHYGNLLFAGPRVVAVLDWEIAHIGQPLVDLGCLLLVAAAARSGNPDLKLSVPGCGGLDVPDRVLLGAYGAAASAEIDWYVALNFYKLAGILGYNLMLHRRGKRHDPIYETRTETVRLFIEEGIRWLA